MLLSELVLVESVGTELVDTRIGYVSAETGEVLLIPRELPHVVVLSLYPDKFGLSPQVRSDIPSQEDKRAVIQWAYNNDRMWGHWQQVIYGQRWVRYVVLNDEFNFSGYATNILAVLSMSGVATEIIQYGRRRHDAMYGRTRLLIDVIRPGQTEGTINAIIVNVGRMSDIESAKQQLYQMAQA